MQASPPGTPASSSPPSPHIEVDRLEVYYGSVPAVRGVSFEVLRGEQLTLLGPSGCGKTTTLRASPGWRPPTRARSASMARRFFRRRCIKVPAERRDLALVFQSYAIWPHMTVFQNVAYPLRVQGRPPRPRSTKRRDHALDLVQLEPRRPPRARSFPAASSSGSRWRARSCAAPVLLLDEPLSNLDARLRAQMRIELRALQHPWHHLGLRDPRPGRSAGDVGPHLVMRDGLIGQTGKPDEIYRLPNSAFVADFVGSAA